MRLASKLTLAFFAVIVLVLTVYTASRISRERETIDAEVSARHDEIGRAIAVPFAEVWELDGEARAMGLVEAIDEEKARLRVRWVWLTPGASEYYRPAAPARVLGPLTRGEQITWDDLDAPRGGRRYTYVPVAIPDTRRGALEISESLEPRAERIETTVLGVIAAMGSIALLCGLAALVVGMWFVGRPVHRLVAMARRVGSGDLRARLDERGTDELGDLAREMNHMADRLQETSRLAEDEHEARMRAMENLRHADRVMTVGTLAAEVAHELGTPLSVAAAHAKAIARGEIDGAEAQMSAAAIADQSERMERIIRRMLDFARHHSSERAAHDLWPIAHAAIDLVSPMAAKHRVAIRLIGDPNRPAIARVNPTQMQQVLANLMLHGIQSMPAGGELELVIARDASEAQADRWLGLRVDGGAGGSLCLQVRDHGTGLGANGLSQLFEPILASRPEAQATGLGLAVVQGIVQDHGGRITVDCPRGGGTAISIYLPPEEPR